MSSAAPPQSSESPVVRGDAWLAERVPPADLEGLSRQGFVSWGSRGARRIAKLRYRSDGRQRVRVIGRDRELAAAVAAALAARQQMRRRELARRRLLADAARALRESWRLVAPEVRAAGFRTHGRSVRRPRLPRAKDQQSPPDPRNGGLNHGRPR